MKLAVVLSHPTQYYSPWFQWLSTHTKIDLRVFYLWDFGIRAQRDPRFQTAFKWDVDLLSGYSHEFVPNVARVPGTEHFGGLRNPDLTTRLSLWNPSALLFFGYKSPSHLRALAWARTHGVPALFRGDSHFLGRGGLGVRQRVMLWLLYAQFAAFLPVGAANTDYFRTLGVPTRKLFFAPHSVNHTLFDPTASAPREQAAGLRAELGLGPDTRVVLFAGKLVAAKQPRALLEAFQRLEPRYTALIFVGDGPEKSALAESIRHSPRNRVHFLPFANQSEMPARYALADLFALPSRGHYETWGLAVNEAMHMGVPALVSDLVGCQRDLVTDGDTGWVFPASSLETLTAKLGDALDLVSDPERQRALRARVQQRISHYTYAATTDGLLRALTAVSPRSR